MAEGSSHGIDWSRSQSFTTAPTGYWSVDVHRLLDDLEKADGAGQELAPIIDARALSEVGLGYDTAQVNAFLDRLRGMEATHVTHMPEATRTPLPERGESLYPPRQEGSEPMSAELLAALNLIESAKFLPARQQFQSGYDAREVDRFFAGLSFAVRAGVSIVPEVRRARFALATRAAAAYDVGPVDDLLDRVGMLAESLDSSGGTQLQEPREVAGSFPLAGARVGLAFGVFGILVAMVTLIVLLLAS